STPSSTASPARICTGQTPIEAEARTTHTRAVRPGGGKEEYLEVAVEGATLLLRLDRLLAITALTEAALFGRIRLREEACSRASGMPSSHLGN
ncbi:Rho-binding antiterminator, partial [Pseudomonas aeruginosa]|uniref:Rho-binding antiterminator n=1 Tax=Pseudomonas aeruginosa TaxID=287 RepID=UPI00396860C4